MTIATNYVIPRGKVFLANIGSNEYRYVGNSATFEVSSETERAELRDSDTAGSEVIASNIISRTDTATMTLNNIVPDNLALWFAGLVDLTTVAGTDKATGTITFSTAGPAAGDSVTINGVTAIFSATSGPGRITPLPASPEAAATALATRVNGLPGSFRVLAVAEGAKVTLTAIQAGTAGNAIALAATFATPGNVTVSGATLSGGVDVSETFESVRRGMSYDLGVTPERPSGVGNVDGVAISGVAATSYEVDRRAGIVTINHDAPDISDGQSITVTYGVRSGVDTEVQATGEETRVKIKFMGDFVGGKSMEYLFGQVLMAPSGTLSLKGDDYMSAEFSLGIEKPDDGTSRIIATQRSQ